MMSIADNDIIDIGDDNALYSHTGNKRCVGIIDDTKRDNEGSVITVFYNIYNINSILNDIINDVTLHIC